jgi:tryptophan synthase alpha chain
MNKLINAFEDRSEKLLSIYFSAGYPQLEDTGRIMIALQKGGADLIEVGIPFSDPVADGPTIQDSNKIALDNGITLKKILEQVTEVKERIQIPVILMGYFNPVYQYGIEKFCMDCQKAGVSGLIIPDLPVQEYQNEYESLLEKHHLANIFLITPQTGEARIRKIDRISKSFIYMVSSASTTGARKGLSQEQIDYFRRVVGMNLKSPLMIGFGISDHHSFTQATKYADGAIIGSAFIKVLKNSDNLEEDIVAYVRSVKGN